MLEINRRSEDPSYKSKGVLLRVNHTLDRNHLAEILRVFHAEFGNQALRDVLVDAELLHNLIPPMPAKPKVPDLFYVLVDGPTHGHFDMGSALAEAKRLAAKEKKSTYVIKRLTHIEPVCGPVSLNVYDL